MTEIVLGVFMFTLLVMTIVFIILGARSRLVAAGDLTITVNDERKLTVAGGINLLNALANKGIFLGSACGGKGSCGQCRCKVLAGGGAILPTETAHISKREAAEGERLSCQVAVKQDLQIEVPREVFGSRSGSAPFIPTITSPPSSRNSFSICRKTRIRNSAPAATSRSNARRMTCRTRISTSEKNIGPTGIDMIFGSTNLT